MGAKKADFSPVDRYVAAHLQKLFAGGVNMADWADKHEITRSHVIQVKNGTLGVGNKTVESYAAAMGRSVGQLFDDAKKWWEEHGATVEGIVAASAEKNPELAKALDLVRLAKQTSDDEIRAIVASVPDVADMSADEIYQVLIVYLERERKRKVAMKTEKKEKASQKRAEQKARGAPFVHHGLNTPERVEKSAEAAGKTSEPKDHERDGTGDDPPPDSRAGAKDHVGGKDKKTPERFARAAGDGGGRASPPRRKARAGRKG